MSSVLHFDAQCYRLRTSYLYRRYLACMSSSPSVHCQVCIRNTADRVDAFVATLISRLSPEARASALEEWEFISERRGWSEMLPSPLCVADFRDASE